MAFVSVMWSVWGMLVVISLVLIAYRVRLERDEADQIFLDDSSSHERIAQENVVAHVKKMQPLLRTFEWLTAAATVFVMGYYISNMVSQFK
jgi:hypothetical protein